MNRLKIVVSALSLALGIPTAAYGADSYHLPSSETASRPWLKMNPKSYAATHASVLEQLDRVGRTDSRITPAKRARLAAMLEAGEGVEVLVPDGIGIDKLTGRCNGLPCVYENMRKQLGRSDRALLFDLGDGVYVYWFTGEKNKSCENIGVVFQTPPPIVYNPPPPKKVVCRVVSRRSLANTGGLGFTFLPGFVLPNCCPQCVPPTFVPALMLQSSSSPDYSTDSITVCE